MGSRSPMVKSRRPPPPCPRPAAMVYDPGNSSAPPQLNQQQSDSGFSDGDGLSLAEGGAIQLNPDGTLVPTQETHPSDIYRPETQEEGQASLENAEKLNEPVQESRDGEEPGEAGQSA